MSYVPVTVVGTWPFSLTAVEYASGVISQGRCAMKAVESGINRAEENADFGCYHVGLCGFPNAKGDVEQDAAIMNGENLDFGGVAAVKRVKYPISLARAVLRESPHNFLSGDGAAEFAMNHNFELVENSLPQHPLPTKMSRQAPEGHDTLGVAALDQNGNFAAGVTTSGKKGKSPGRIGDSPLPGGGLYADNEGGAVVATGDGDEILKYCPTFRAVHLMTKGFSAQAACEEVVKTIASKVAPREMFEIGLLAIDKEGNMGAATSIKEWTDCMSQQSYPGFPVVVWNPRNSSEVLLDVIASICD